MDATQSVISAVSFSHDPKQAAQELSALLCHPDLDFVLFFCSAEYPLDQLAQSLNDAFDGVELVGCTTAGELTPQGYGKGCITAIGFDKRSFSVTASLINSLSGFNLMDAQKLVETLTSRCSERQVAPTKDNTFAMTLLDGLSSQEELVLSALGSALGAIPHFGGSAGDDIHLTNTHVFCNGRFHTEAAVMIMFNTVCEFEVFSTHHMKSLDKKLVVTDANPEARTVYELNAEPAALEYSRTVGVPLDELTFEIFALNPIAVRFGDEFFVRSIQRVNDDLSLTFYCAVENGIVLTLMEPGDMLANLTTELERIEQTIGIPQLLIGCDCFLRRLELESLDIRDQASELLQRYRVIGFNTYGEHIAGMHINQTFTGVAIGRAVSE